MPLSDSPRVEWFECPECGHHKLFHHEDGCSVSSRLSRIHDAEVDIEVECSCERTKEELNYDYSR